MFFLLLGIVVSTLVGVATLIFTTQFTSPTSANESLIIINLIYFFAAAFISLAGSTTLVLYWLGSWREKNRRRSEIESIHRPKIILRTSLRHGVLVAIAITGVGILNSLKVSNPLNIILLISAVILIEIYFFGH